jgi:hypothetical protein
MLELLLKFAPLGSLITATVAVCAAIFAWTQIKLNRQNEAKRQFLNFLDECIKYPLVAEAKHNHDNIEDMHRYRWFVFKLLMCSESILDEFPGDEEWKNAVIENISPHIKFIEKNVIMRCYSIKMQSEVDKLLNGNTDNRPTLPELK